MTAIVLQFSAQHDVGSDLIEWFSQGIYSHVDTVLPDGRLLGARSDVVGGAPAGVQIRTPDYAPFIRKLIVPLPCEQHRYDRYHRFLEAQLGKPYDSTAILAFAFGRDWQEEDSWFCSELVAAGLCTSLYFTYPLAAPANKITPDSLLLCCSTQVGIAV